MPWNSNKLKPVKDVVPDMFFNVSNPSFKRQGMPVAAPSKTFKDDEGEKIGKMPTYTNKFNKLRKMAFGG